MKRNDNSLRKIEKDNVSAAAQEKLHAWLYEHTLPAWQQQGVDYEAGGFHEKLDENYQPIVRDGKRLVVQARQIYVYSHAAVHGLLDGALETALHGYNFLTTHYRSKQGWRHSVQRDGKGLDNRCDFYDQAFVVFAMAWLFQASGDKQVLSLAEETIDILDMTLLDKLNGGYKEGLDANGQMLQQPRRQNPHMHLLEALLALYDATTDSGYLDRAAQLITLANDKFIVDGTLREYFTTNLKPVAAADGRLVEPGHHFEWVWLLYRYGELSDSLLECTKIADRLYRFAVGHGINQHSGGVFDQVDYIGTPVKTSRRVWPQTEAIKAHAVRAAWTRDSDALKWHDKTLTTLIRDHLSTEGLAQGAWQERVGPDGDRISGMMPGSTLYHLVFACSETERLVGLANSYQS